VRDPALARFGAKFGTCKGNGLFAICRFNRRSGI
jgi:hypothetical protein